MAETGACITQHGNGVHAGGSGDIFRSGPFPGASITGTSLREGLDLRHERRDRVGDSGADFGL